MAGCVFAQAERPVCNAKMQGKFWPEEANRDKRAMFELSRKGELQICSAKRRKTFRWEQVGIHVSQFARGPQPAAEESTASDSQKQE